MLYKLYYITYMKYGLSFTIDTFYTMTNSFPTLSITTVSSYRTMACTLKSAALLALILYLKINCFGSLVTLSV